jgi:hypothetical protein
LLTPVKNKAEKKSYEKNGRMSRAWERKGAERTGKLGKKRMIRMIRRWEGREMGERDEGRRGSEGKFLLGQP